MELVLGGSEAGQLASALFDLMPCPVWIHAAGSLALLYFNPAGRERLGLSQDEPVGSALQIVPDWQEPTTNRQPGQLRSRDGRVFDADLSTRSVTVHGAPAWLVVANDLIERDQADQALAAAEARYRSLFQNAVEGIFQTSPKGKYLDANPALARIYGYETPAELMASVTDISRQLYADPTRREEFVRLMREQDVVEGFESQIIRKDNSSVWISEYVRAVRDDAGGLLYYEGTVVDITQRKVAEERLRHDASHDKLTGLPNRAFFMHRTAEALRKSGSQQSCALLFLDFDRFKLINDSLGHLTGDQFLRSAAKRLAGALRPGDIVARLGGDEFGILLPGIKSLSAATQVADRVQRRLLEPFEVDGRRLFVTASLGIALGDESYTSPEDLLRDADMAMYQAKEGGRARQELFDARMRERTLERFQLETDLRTATGLEQFVIHFQPVVHLETGRVASFEALLRWNHPTRGLIYPREFISVAEEMGAILDIGAWMVEMVCHQARQWEQVGDLALPISFNASSRQFLQPEFGRLVARALDGVGLSGSLLKIEITERILMENPEGIGQMLNTLRDRGIGISLDDFGTGFSSFSYLQRFPIDELKIDRAFVARIESEDPSSAILTAMINMAHTLGMNTVAEGVETAAQARELRRLGCAFAQGYHFSPPLPTEQATGLAATGYRPTV